MKNNFENPALLVEDSAEQFQKIARENFSVWNQALQTGNAQVVGALYSPESTFLPTVSGEFKKGPGEASEYFEHFLKKDPVGEIIDESVQKLGPDSYLHSGMYNFELGPEEKRDKMEARFSFVWKKDEDGQWKIIHHHSSVKPK